MLSSPVRSLENEFRSVSIWSMIVSRGEIGAVVAAVVAAAAWAVWPDDPTSFTPNWQVYEVVFDLPGSRRVTAVWNGDGTPLRVRIPRHAPQATVVDPQNQAQAATAGGQDWTLQLPPATAHFSGDPSGYYFIGGEPRLLIEEGVPPGTPVTPPTVY